MPDVKQLVQEKYGEAARRVGTGGSACCGTSPASDGCCDPITSNLYDASQVSSIPEEAHWHRSGAEPDRVGRTPCW
jgi:hypothetical protein